MITLSTCATAEDHAAGNYWADEFHNPEHRIDKIGVLRSLRPSLRRPFRIRTPRCVPAILVQSCGRVTYPPAGGRP